MTTEREPLTSDALEALPRDSVIYVGSPVFAIADDYKRVSGGWRRFNARTFRPFGETLTSARVAELGAYT
jgi:hypothetical protein